MNFSKIKKIIVSVLAISMLVPGTTTIYADPAGDETEENIKETVVESAGDEVDTLLNDITNNRHAMGGMPVEVHFVDADVNNYADGDENAFLVADRTHEDKYIPTAKDLPDMRNQGEWGNCWAHSAIAAVEMSAIKHGLSDNTIDLSELQISRFTNSPERNFDEFDNIINDKNFKKHDFGIEDEYITGGNTCFTSQALVAHMGLVNEADDPKYSWSEAHASKKDKFGQADSVYINAAIQYKNDFDAKKTDAYNTFIQNLYGGIDHIERNKTNAYGRDQLTVTGYKYTPVGINSEKQLYDTDDVKTLVEDYGGLSIFYYHTDKSCLDTDGDGIEDAYYYDGVYGADDASGHLITLVGWDDNFAKENFELANGAMPAGDGAWLMRNSWDTNYTRGLDPSAKDYTYDVNQYFWMSYYTDGLCDAYAFDVEKTDALEHLYQYDGGYFSEYFNDDNRIMTANIFTVSSNAAYQKLEAVEVDTGTTNSDLVIKIVKNPSDNNPLAGELIGESTTNAFRGYTGYGKYELKAPVYLKPGDTYAIVVEAIKQGYNPSIAVEATYTYYIDKDGKKVDYWKPTVAYAQRGQSFVYFSDDDKWYDVLDIESSNKSNDVKYGNLRIKGITRDVSEEDYNSGIQAAVEASKAGYGSITDTVKLEKNEKKYLITPSGEEDEITVMQGNTFIVNDTADKNGITGTANAKKKYTYYSSNSKLVSVSAKGVVKAKKAGIVAISYSKGGVIKTLYVTVKAPKMLLIDGSSPKKLSTTCNVGDLVDVRLDLPLNASVDKIVNGKAASPAVDGLKCEMSEGGMFRISGKAAQKGKVKVTMLVNGKKVNATVTIK